MAEPVKKDPATEIRNRLSSIRAGQDQMSREVEKTLSTVQNVLILQIYLIGLGVVVWLLLRSQGVSGGKAA